MRWIAYDGMATCQSVVDYIYDYGNQQFGYGQTKPEKKRREQMTLYRVYFLDIRRAVVTSDHTVVGRDEADAMLSVSLTEEEKKLKQRDELEVVWQKVGEFEKLKKSRVTIEKDDEL